MSVGLNQPFDMNFYTLLTTFVLGLLGVGQLHEYLVSGKAPENYKDAPLVFRNIIESHDRANARRLVQAASYANAAGQYAVIPGNLARTCARLTGRVERDRFDQSPVHVSVEGLTDSEILRAQRFLVLNGKELSLLDEPTDVKPDPSNSIRNHLVPNTKMAVSRELQLRLALKSATPELVLAKLATPH